MEKYYQKGLYKVCCFLSMMILMLGVQVTAVAQTQVNSAANGKVVAAKNITALDGRQVQLSVSGQMPSKAKVQATPVQRTSPNGKQVFGAYDITIQNGNAEWQPQAGQPVMVSISDPNFTDGQMMDVYHEGANGNEFVATVAAQNGTITFPARSFSVYIVTEVGEGARLEVVFHQQNGGSTSIFVKAKDALNDETYETVLYDPGVGALVNTIQFRGWYTSETYTVANADDGMSIAEVRDLVEPMLTNVTDGTKYHLYPLLFKIYHVTYYDELGTIISSKEVLYLPNDDQDYHACPINEAYMPSSSEQNFMGWQVLDGGENIQGHTSGMLYQNGTSININGDVKFKADVPFGHWLTFNENGKGASFTAAQFIENEQVTSAPSNPTRFGYTFGGWYTVQYADDETADPANAFTFGEELEANTPLYAKWIPNTTASYTIIIWKQNVHDPKNATDANKTYDFAESVSLTGTVGNVINAVTSSGTGDGSYAVVNSAAKQYEGFHLDRYDQNVTIVTEGTSVLNVYYDRNLVTLEFRTRTSNYSTNTTVYQTMTGLYGSSLTENGYTWPTAYWWYENNQNGGTGNTRTTFLDAFKIPTGASSETFYGFTGSGSNNIYFYKQNDEGGYTLANTVTTGNGIFYISDKYNGYKAVSYSTNNSTWTQLGDKDPETGYYGSIASANNRYIRFDRLTYNLLYNDGVYVDGNNNPVEGYESRGELNEVTGIPFESSMTSYNKDGGNYYAPTFSGFAFEGWYIDDACTQPYTFTVMPEGLTVYAKWRQVQYRVFLHPNAVDPETNELDSTLQVGNQAMCFRVDFGEKVQDITLTRDDYTLMGWYSDAACTQVFNSSMVVLNDLSVTSNYDKTVDMTDPMNRWGLIVNDSIDPNTGNPITPYNSDITGWQHVVNGETVNDDRFWINKKLDLYAKWRSKLEGAKGIHIEYVFIKENQTDDLSDDETIVIFIKQEEDLFNNEVSTFSIAAPTSFEDMPNPSDSVFKHWVIQHWNSTTEKFEDSEVTVYPGSPFTISKNDAQRIDNEEYHPETNPNVDQYIYTIRVRAEYIPVEQATPSHIIWYTNYDADDQTIVRQDGTYNNVPGDEPHVVLAINEAVTIPVPEERTGFNFLGWMRYASGDDVTPSAATAPNFLWYNAETEKFYSNATMTTEATYVAADEEQPYHDLYAIWEAASYTVHFNNNGADGTETMEDQLFEFDQEQALTTNAFTYTDHCFQGWATSATTGVVYSDGESVVNLTETPGAVVNLYAVWEEKVTPVFDDILQTEYCLNAEASTLPTSSKEVITEDATIPVVNGTWKDATGATVNSVSTATAGTVTLTFVPEEDACAKPVEVEFTVNPLPTVNLTVPTDAQVLCPNKDTYPVSAEATGGTAPYSYAWSGATPTTENGPAANVLQVENNCTENGYPYTVSVVATDDNGCASAEAEKSFTVEMPENASITFTQVESSKTVDCASDVVAPTTLPIAKDACNNELIPTGPVMNPTTAPACGGTVTYTYTYTDCAGNTADWVYTYTVSEPAAPTLSYAQPVAIPAGGCKYEIPAVDYQVSAACNGNVTVTQTPEANTFVNQTDQAQVVEITLTATDECDNTTTEIVVVNIPAKPTVDITPSSTTVCNGGSATLTASEGFTSYAWSNQKATASITVENLTETTTFTVTATDANGCTAEASQEVTVNEIGTVTITGADAVCMNGDVTLTAPEGETYSWSTGEETQSITVSKMTATTTFYVTVTDANGCVSEGEKEVTVNPLPNVTASANPATIYYGGTSELSATGASTYSWNVTNTTVSPEQTTTYTVTGTDANGCENTATVTVTVQNAQVTFNLDTTKVYDGTEFVVTTADLQSHITGLVDGHVLASGTITSDDYVYGNYTCADGSSFAPVEGVAVKSGFRIDDQSGNDVTAHYTPAFHVTLHITQQPLTVTAASDSKLYDGTPLTNDQYTVTGLVDGDALVAQVTGSQTEVGTSNNLVGTVTITRGNRDVTESYEITKMNGTLTITSVDCQGVTYQDYYYPAVQIGTQCWLAENLRNTVYGPEETTAIADYAAYKNDEANMEKFGYLYTWYSAVGVEENNNAAVPETLEGTSLVQGICPEGWVVPSQTDFDILYIFTANEARRLRDMNTMYWIPGEQGVEPNYHFNSRAGGFYNSTSGQFERILLEDYYWTSTSDPNTTEVTTPMNAYYCNSINFKTSKKSDKRSVRCISVATAYDENAVEPVEPEFRCGTDPLIIGENSYETVQIGTQCWTKTNMREPAGTNGTDLTGENTSDVAQFYYLNPDVDATVYGYYYNWPAANEVCPDGWHLPSDEEWTLLENYVSNAQEGTVYVYRCDQSDATSIAKALASETDVWISYAGECYPGDQSVKPNNATGFSAVPAGYCSGSSFYRTGAYAYFWSSTQDSSGYADYRGLNCYYAGVFRNYGLDFGFSVRCLRD